MNAKEVSKMTMYGGFYRFIGENVGEFTDYEPMTDHKTQIDSLYVTLTEQAKVLATDNTAFSEEKENAKLLMAETAATLAGIGQIGLRKAGLTNEAAQLHTAVYEYSAPSDVEAAALAGNTYTLLFNNKAVLTKYITDALLAKFDTEIQKFANTKGSSTQVKQSTPQLTKAFKGNVRTMDGLIDDMVILGKLYKDTKPDFYNKLEANAVVPPVAVNHTSLSVTVKSKTTLKPVANATLTLSMSTKTDITDDSGFAGIDTVRSGTATLGIVAAGYKPYGTQVSITRSKDNHFDVELEGE